MATAHCLRVYRGEAGESTFWTQAEDNVVFTAISRHHLADDPVSAAHPSREAIAVAPACQWSWPLTGLAEYPSCQAALAPESPIR